MKHIDIITLTCLVLFVVFYILLSLSISKIRNLEREVEKLEEQNSKCYYLSDTIAEVYNIK